MAETRTIDVKVHPRLDAVTVRPGDKLVVRIDGSRVYTREEIDEWAAHLEGLIPGVEIVFIPAGQLLVYRPVGGVDE